MIDDGTIHVAIPSYGRAGLVTTLDIAPWAWVWVCESQAAEYRAHYGDRVIVVPDSLDGSIARKRNAILDRAPSRWILMLDDDLTGVRYYERGGNFRLSAAALAEVIEHHFMLAAGLGARLWGINQIQDARLYDTYEPYNLLGPVLGPFCGHLDPVLRYDETTNAKEDYDFWLQNIRRHRRTLRANKYHYSRARRRGGGVVGMRSRAYELAGAERMIRKWGADVYVLGGQAGTGATGKNILNSKVRVPIAGC